MPLFNPPPAAGMTWVPAYGIVPANMAKWRRAVARVRSGTGYADVLCVGDSTTWGSGAGTVQTNAYPVRLRAMLSAAGLTAAEGIAWANARVPSDARWSLGTGWSYSTGFGPGDSMGASAPSGSAGALSFVPGYLFDSITVYYAINATKGSVTVNVDGGASLGTINASGSNAIGVSATFTVARATHTINITGPTGGDAYIFGIRAWDSTTNSVRISNAGAPSTKTADWIDVSLPFSSLPFFDTVAPDLSIINLTVNDSTQGTVFATWQAQITTILQRAQLAGDIMLVAGVPSNPSTYAGITATQQNYAATLKGLAAQYGGTMVDLVGRWTDYPTSNALGFYAASDNLHPSVTGYTDVAMAIRSALAI